jgi:hypothetical protein
MKIHLVDGTYELFRSHYRARWVYAANEELH